MAEKFKDFELLIEMCINANDLESLYSYIDKYTNEVSYSAVLCMLSLLFYYILRYCLLLWGIYGKDSVQSVSVIRLLF